MNVRALAVPLLVLLPLMLLPISGAEAALHQYVEDFSTKGYCDTLETTAWWDTGGAELKLPAYEPTIVGALDTPGHAGDLTISGDHAFVCDGFLGLSNIRSVKWVVGSHALHVEVDAPSSPHLVDLDHYRRHQPQ